MVNNLVSIITPAYNEESNILNCINSVKKQTYADWEMLIVDDASTDNTNNIVKEQIKKDNRIKLFTLEKNHGIPCKAREIAIQKAKGRYIAFLDADDLWLPKKLELQLEFMKKNSYPFTYTDYVSFSDNPQIIKKHFKAPPKIDYNRLLKQNQIGCLTVILDKQKIKKINLWQGQIDDFALWLDILKRIKYAYGLNEVLAKYKIGKNRMSTNKIYAAKGVWDVYRNSQKYNFLKSIYYFSHYALLSLMKHSK